MHFYVLGIVLILGITTATNILAVEAPYPDGMRYHPNFIASAPDPMANTHLKTYMTAWVEALKNIRQFKDKDRANYFDWQPQVARDLWKTLIAPDDGAGADRRELLRLPSYPGWEAVAFSGNLLPCGYFARGANFSRHTDLPYTRPFEVIDPEPCSKSRPCTNLAKLVLYLGEFQGGEFLLYRRPTSAFLDEEEGPLATIAPESGSAILFDLRHPHASTALQSKRKLVLGLRVIYAHTQSMEEE